MGYSHSFAQVTVKRLASDRIRPRDNGSESGARTGSIESDLIEAGNWRL
jgi:hypothetical protein